MGRIGTFIDGYHVDCISMRSRECFLPQAFIRIIGFLTGWPIYKIVGSSLVDLVHIYRPMAEALDFIERAITKDHVVSDLANLLKPFILFLDGSSYSDDSQISCKGGALT